MLTALGPRADSNVVVPPTSALHATTASGGVARTGASWRDALRAQQLHTTPSSRLPLRDGTEARPVRCRLTL